MTTLADVQQRVRTLANRIGASEGELPTFGHSERCRQHVITAPVPDKVFDKTQYGPGFIAHLVVSKCCDSLPLYRMEQQFGRLGIPMPRSTMTDLFHRAGELVAPLAQRIVLLIAASEVVLADETRCRCKTIERSRTFGRSFQGLSSRIDSA